jgi:molecular chaperone GrpE
LSKKSEHEEAESAKAPVGEVEGELERVVRERDDLLGKLQRATADYQNLRRRQQADVDAAVKRGLESLLQNLLLVLDHLDLALAAPADSEETKNFARGVALTRDQFLGVLAQEGVTPMGAGASFDPTRHEAVATVERADLSPGTIVDVVRRGYAWRDKVLRVAHVRVATAPKNEAQRDQG